MSFAEDVSDFSGDDGLDDFDEFGLPEDEPDNGDEKPQGPPPGGEDDDDEGDDDLGAPADPCAPAGPAPESRRLIIVPPDERQGSNILNGFEKTRAIAIRAKQIADHGVAFVDAGGLTSAVKIAEKELEAGKNPLVLCRQMGTLNGERIVELWPVREMSILPK